MKFISLFFLLFSTQAWAEWSVTTYNIRNFDRDYQMGNTDIAELTKIVRSVKSDVYGFQEVVNEKAFRDFVEKALPDYSVLISSCGGSGKQKLAIAYNRHTFSFLNQYEDLSFTGSQNGKCGSLRPLFLVSLQNKSTKKKINFGVVHLKAGGASSAMARRWKQYRQLMDFSGKYENENLILLGDFNTTGYNIKNEDFYKFDDFISKSSLRTTSEEVGCTNYWYGTLGNGEYESSILDHVVVQDHMMKEVKSVKVKAHCSKSCAPTVPEDLGRSFEAVSDHCPVQVTFK